MAEGRVVAEGPPDTVMKDQAVIDAYLGAHHDTDLGEMTTSEIATIHAEFEAEEDADFDAEQDGDRR